MPLGLSKNLFQRIVAALLLLPPVLAIIWAGGFWYTGLLAVGGILMMLEWLNMTNISEVLTKAACCLFVLTAVMFGHLTSGFPGISAMLLGIAVPLSLVYVSLKNYDGKEGRGLHLLRWGGNGTLYVMLPLVALGWLRGVDDGMFVVIWTFIIVWATDVGGYFFGKGIGGPKLAPIVSPNKTWSGLAGGMFLSGVASTIFAYFVGWQSFGFIIIVSLLLAVVAQLGDLFESAVKRTFNVKDSGGLIPGHGGILDRVDGLVFTAPAMALIVDYYPIQ